MTCALMQRCRSPDMSVHLFNRCNLQLQLFTCFFLQVTTTLCCTCSTSAISRFCYSHVFYFAGHYDIVLHLLNRCNQQVLLDSRNALGFTPLMKAALQGRTKIAKALLFSGSYSSCR